MCTLKKMSTLGLITLATVSVAFAQYGVIENFEGTVFGAAATDENLYGGVSGFYSFGAAGGGSGEGSGFGNNGTRGVDGGGGGDLLSGGYGFQCLIPGGVDTTVSYAGMTTTGFAVDYKDNDATPDGDIWQLRFETGDFNNARSYSFTAASPGSWESFSFNFADTADSVVGTPSLANITNVLVAQVGLDGGTAGDNAFNFDNFRFIGNNAPNTGDLETYGGEAIGDDSPVNAYGGLTQAYAWGGATAIAASGVVDLSGDKAYRTSLTDSVSPPQGGVYVDLVPVAGNVDLSAFQSLRLDAMVALADVGDQFEVRIETVDAPGFDFWKSTITPTDTMATYSIPFNTLTGGPGGSFDPSLAKRITIAPVAESSPNNATDITIDNVYLSASVPVELSIFASE